MNCVAIIFVSTEVSFKIYIYKKERTQWDVHFDWKGDNLRKAFRENFPPLRLFAQLVTLNQIDQS